MSGGPVRVIFTGLWRLAALLNTCEVALRLFLMSFGEIETQKRRQNIILGTRRYDAPEVDGRCLLASYQTFLAMMTNVLDRRQSDRSDLLHRHDRQEVERLGKVDLNVAEGKTEDRATEKAANRILHAVVFFHA